MHNNLRKVSLINVSSRNACCVCACSARACVYTNIYIYIYMYIYRVNISNYLSESPGLYDNLSERIAGPILQLI